jgi:DNA-binding SARP family transcriptional activator
MTSAFGTTENPIGGGAPPPGFEFLLLGPLSVSYRGQPVPVGAPKHRALLAALVVDANRVVSVDTLVERLWGERAPSGARVTLQNHVMRLRRVLASVASVDPVLTATDGYLLAADDDRIDLRRFDTLLDRAAAILAEADPARARPLLVEALALWRGDALVDIRSDALHREVVPGLSERRLRAVELRVEVDLRLGRHAQLIAELAELTARYPLREGLWTARLLALYRSGRQAEALAAYRFVSGLLARDLGIDPGPALRDMHRAVLANDPGLRAPTTQLVIEPGHVIARSTRDDLPAQLPDFTGRATETGQLLALPARGGTALVATIDGMPGVGKTALAVRAAHLLGGHYPDARLYLDLHGHSPREQPVRPFAALGGLLQALGVPDLPSTVEERSALLRITLADRRALILLDNAASGAQLRPLLPGTPGCLVLVTSRRRLADVDAALALSLDVLPPAGAIRLFQRVSGVESLEDSREVVRRCGYLPLAIRIAAAKLRTRPTWTAQHLVSRLRSRNRLTELAVGDRSVLTAFDTSYQRLGPAQQGLFRLLGRLPAAGFDLCSAAAVAGLPPVETERLLEDLLDAQLLDASEPTRYRAHELIREYAGILEHTAGHQLTDDRLAAAHSA